MKFIRVLKAYNEETELYPNSNKATLVFNVTLDFNNPITAIQFRQHLPKDESQKIHINYDDEKKLRLYSSENPEELLQQDERTFKYHNMDYVLPPNATHLEFRVYKDIGNMDFLKKDDKDYSGELEKTRKEIIDLFSNYTPNVKATLIPPQMKSFDYKNKDYMEMRDRVDSLFEGLSTAEIRDYDFVIVGKDKTEAKAIEKFYIDNSRYSTHKWQYTKKDKIRNDDYENKRGDMAYIKTTSDELDNGIYCLTVRARNYFKSWKGEQITLIPIYDAKASQLGGKVVIAKKNNFIRVLKAGYEWDYENDCEIRQWDERCDATFMTEDGKEKHKYFTVTLDEDDDTYYYINELDDTASSEKEMFEMITKKCEDLAERKGWKFISLSNLYL